MAVPWGDILSGVGLVSSLLGGKSDGKTWWGNTPQTGAGSLWAQQPLQQVMRELQRTTMRPVNQGLGLDASSAYQQNIHRILGQLRGSGLAGDTRANSLMAQGAGRLAGTTAGIGAQNAFAQQQGQMNLAQLLEQILTGQASNSIAQANLGLNQQYYQDQKNAQNAAALGQIAQLLNEWTQPKTKPAPNPTAAGVNAGLNAYIPYLLGFLT